MKELSKLEFSAYENEKVQNLFYRIDNTQMQVLSQCLSFFPTVLQYTIELAGIFYYVIIAGYWWLFPIGIIISLPSLYFNKKRVVYARKVWSSDNADMRYAEQLNIRLIDREGCKERRLNQFSDSLSNLWTKVFKKYNMNKINCYIKSSVSTGIAMCFSMATIVLFGLILIAPLKHGHITIGFYTSLVITVNNKMNMCINSLIREFTNLIAIKNYRDDMNEFHELNKIDLEELRTENEEESYNNRTNTEFRSIRFENVYFKYPDTNTYILKGVSFEIKQGMHCGLIGINGAGKTTITKLMLGLYQPTKGKIYLNDKDISQYSYRQIQKIYAILQQNGGKYKLSLRENIALYHLEEKDNTKNIDQIFEKYNRSFLVSKCNNSYDTYLTPEFNNGIMLSGGEWQNVEFIRAMFARHPFIILDEPTAALDPLAEIEFYKSYKQDMSGHTCLFITHRLGSTYLFDQCFVLSDGIIKESGTHDELIQIKDGCYKKLFIRQSKWYKEEA